MILTEFDPSKKAVINPEDIITPVEGMPEVAVACYSHMTFERMIGELDAEVIAETSNANGVDLIYKAAYKGIHVALFMIDVGAPMSVGILEEVFMMGVKKAIIFGTCGVLDKSIDDCSVIIPDCAVRDEGTSYHYAPASDEIEVNRKYLKVFTGMLDELQVKYTIGKTWSTDAFYRETPEKVRRRKEQGCICVDMECSADAALAQFREKDLVQFFYAADNLDAEEWDVRSLSNHSRLEEKDRIAMIALELAVRISR
ncbi:MAG: nucleoside phosphorylase [Lachnospiraceae bacterium]|nr:nucleoside phosphorylase [Lachnospiraceae bacterium]